MTESSTAEGAVSLYLPVRIVRAYIGVWALAWDGARSLARNPQQLYKRGAAAEAEIEASRQSLVDLLESAPANTVAAVRRVLRAPFLRVQDGLDASSAVAEQELEHQVEAALARLGIPSRERILRLGREIDALTARIDRELERLESVTA